MCVPFLSVSLQGDVLNKWMNCCAARAATSTPSSSLGGSPAGCSTRSASPTRTPRPRALPTSLLLRATATRADASSPDRTRSVSQRHLINAAFLSHVVPQPKSDKEAGEPDAVASWVDRFLVVERALVTEDQRLALMLMTRLADKRGGSVWEGYVAACEKYNVRSGSLLFHRVREEGQLTCECVAVGHHRRQERGRDDQGVPQARDPHHRRCVSRGTPLAECRAPRLTRPARPQAPCRTRQRPRRTS